MSAPDPTAPNAKPAENVPGGAPSIEGPIPLGDTAKPLTPEEQMEEFAKKLKEEDWGHQPC